MTIKDILQKFDEKFYIAEFRNVFQKGNITRIFRDEVYPDDIKSFISSSFTSLIEDMEKEVNGLQKYTGGSSVEQKDFRIKLKDILSIIDKYKI